MSLPDLLHLTRQDLDARLLILAAAVMAALTVAVTSRQVAWPRGRTPGRQVAAYLSGGNQAAAAPPPDIRIERTAVIAASLGLPPHPRLLPGLQLLAGALPLLTLLLLGYPPVIALGAGSLGAVLAGTWLQGRWRRFCNQVEQELPVFTSRLAGTLLVTVSPIAALEDVVAGLGSGPLHLWMDAFILGLRQTGRTRFLNRAQQEANTLSVSLALVVFTIGRLLETGGSGFTAAFTATAEHLTGILRARAVARAKAEAARSAVLTMLAIMGVIMLLMLSAEQNRAAYRDPAVQLVACLCLSVMGLGYLVLNRMIDAALED